MMTSAGILLFRGRGIASTLIRWQTRGPWSHAAISLGMDAWEAREWRRVARRTLGEIVAECMRDKVRLERISVPITAEQARDMRDWLDDQVGKRYDWGSVLRFVSRRQSRRKAAEVWFCSELVFAAFAHVDIDLLARTEPWEVSPSLLGRTTAGEIATIARGH